MSFWSDPARKEAALAKAAETRAYRRAERERKRAEAEARVHYLSSEIEDMEQRLAALRFEIKANEISALHTGQTLMREQDIVAAAQPWKRCSGVYFLVAGDRVVYVGQSVDVHARISDHKKKQFDAVAWVPCDPGLLDKLESLYIHVLQPPLNGHYNGQSRKIAPLRLDELLHKT